MHLHRFRHIPISFAGCVAIAVLLIASGLSLGWKSSFIMAVTVLIMTQGGSSLLLLIVPDFRKSPLFHLAASLAGFFEITFGYLLCSFLKLPGSICFVGPLIFILLQRSIVLFIRKSSYDFQPYENFHWYFLGLVLLAVSITLFFTNYVQVETAYGLAYPLSPHGEMTRHIALVHEFLKPGFPPQNPFFVHEPLRYPWLMYPCIAWMASMPGAHEDIQTIFICFSLMTGVLYVYMLWLMMPAHRSKRKIIFWSIFFAIAGLSFSGILFIILALINQLEIWPALLDYSVKPQFWQATQLQIQNSFHTTLINPQHLLAVILVLSGALISARNEKRYCTGIEAFLIGASLGTSPIIGIMGCIAFFMRLSTSLKDWRRMLSGVTPLLMWILVFFLSRSISVEGPALMTVLEGRWYQYLVLFLVNYGLIGVIAIYGLYAAYRKNDAESEAFLDLGAVALFCLIFVRLDNNPAEVGLRAGLLLIPVIIYGFVHTYGILNPKYRKGIWVLSSFALLTIGIEGYNISVFEKNLNYSTMNRDELDACRFIASSTQQDAVIQALPEREQRRKTKLIPAFGERRSCLNDPDEINDFRIPTTLFNIRQALISKLFSTDDPNQLLEIAHHLKIQYLFIGPFERAHMTDSLLSVRFFPLVYRNQSIQIYKTENAVNVDFDSATSKIKLENREQFYHRQFIVTKKPSMDIFPGDPQWVDIPPVSQTEISLESGNKVFSIPRLVDLGIPLTMDMIGGHQNYATAGNLIGWPKSPHGQIIQVLDNPPGSLWKEESLFLPPGNYRILIYYHADQTEESPCRLTLVQKNTIYPPSSVIFPDCEDSTLEFVALPVQVALHRWTETEWMIEYGGAGVFSLSHIDFEMIPVAQEWSESYSFSPASEE